VEAELKYHKPIHYDELMQIEVSIYERPTVRLSTYYRVITERYNGVHVSGKVQLAFMNQESRRPMKVPQSFLDPFNRAIEKQEGSSVD
jgi:acyl-CoA thioester hydrolase